jgi:DNA processing protein
MPLVDFVALSLLPVRRWHAIAIDLRVGRSPAAILETQLAALPAEHPLLRRLGSLASMRAQAAAAIDIAARHRLDALTSGDPAYPLPLAAIVDPPPVLWLRGMRAALDSPAVAIVGSRAGSPYALAVAERLSADLAERGITIVSGLARGVDSAAHRGALSVGGRTIAVLGCGADLIYPPEHQGLADEIAGRGAVISELIPGTPPRSWLFPQRNRIISGLSRATVVVEAGEKSGSLITARCAMEQGRDVLAVPGNVLNGRNRGGHALLRDGARIVETADDVIDELGLTSATLHAEPRPAASSFLPAASSDPVLAAIGRGDTCDLDGIAERTGLSAARLLPRLFELEMLGVVKRVGGGRFVRFDSSC